MMGLGEANSAAVECVPATEIDEDSGSDGSKVNQRVNKENIGTETLNHGEWNRILEVRVQTNVDVQEAL